MTPDIKTEAGQEMTAVQKHSILLALKQSDDALSELMACSTELLNSRVAKNLFKQCHEAQLETARILQREGISPKGICNTYKSPRTKMLDDWVKP